MPYDRKGDLPPIDLPASLADKLSPRIDFDRYVPFALTALANRIARGASRTYLERFGVGINEWRILAHLRVRPGVTANLICQTADLDKAAVSRALRGLDEQGLIETGNTDARGRSLRLTKTGGELHDRIILVALNREAKLLEGFSDAERQQLRTFIARMQANAEGLEKD